LSSTPASGASLLLNLEGGIHGAPCCGRYQGVNFDRRSAVGVCSSSPQARWPLVACWERPKPGVRGGGGWGALAIAGACLAWALDNNFTRQVSAADPVQIAMLKGLTAGVANTCLAMSLGAHWPTSGRLAAIAVVGFMGYGVSLVMFVLALRHLGTARTAAYFSLAPFLGAALSILWLQEPLTAGFGIAAALMLVGVWLHLSERHEHEHTHGAVEHEHWHHHDVHHRHAHDPSDPAGEPHGHRHRHEPLTHRHPHYPDVHHRHDH
jgi:hypothetical protein